MSSYFSISSLFSRRSSCTTWFTSSVCLVQWIFSCSTSESMISMFLTSDSSFSLDMVSGSVLFSMPNPNPKGTKKATLCNMHQYVWQSQSCGFFLYSLLLILLPSLSFPKVSLIFFAWLIYLFLLRCRN